MLVESPVLLKGEMISSRYTCDGEDLSPPLVIKEVPKEAESLALIMDDPDAPMGVFVHWVAWNLDPRMEQLEEGVSLQGEGKNDFGTIGYRGPCPPKGELHRYYFKVYALDRELDLSIGSSKADLEEAMEGHILDQAELMGTYRH